MEPEWIIRHPTILLRIHIVYPRLADFCEPDVDQISGRMALSVTMLARGPRQQPL